MDVSLKRFSDIHTSGGALNSTVHLSLKELEACSGYEAWLGGLLRQVLGGYTAIWMIDVVLCLFACMMSLSIRERKKS
jgi:predicted MFS family arabinose efflux permease